jgi:hypothetical protein
MIVNPVIKGYEVKNVKTGIGHDLAGYNLSLYKDGKKIATVDDDGYGGEVSYYFVSKEVEIEFDNFIKSEEKLRAKTHVPKTELDKIIYAKVGFIYTRDFFVDELINAYDSSKQMRAACKREVCFQIEKDIGTDQYNYLKVKYAGNKTLVDQYMNNKYPGQKIRIINKELKE